MLTLSEFGDIIFKPWHRIIRFFQFKVNRKVYRQCNGCKFTQMGNPKAAWLCQHPWMIVCLYYWLLMVLSLFAFRMQGE
jgi:hypothetical protein